MNDRQKEFVTQYLVDLNATQAAIRAGMDWLTPGAGHYVYLLIDPRNGSIFYVGKGKGRRRLAHAAELRRQRSTNGTKYRLMQQIQLDGLEHEAVIFAGGMAESEAFRIERELIQALPSLTNIAQGVVTSDEAARDRAIAMLAATKPFDVWADALDPVLKRSVLNVWGSLAVCYDEFVSGLQKLAARPRLEGGA